MNELVYLRNTEAMTDSLIVAEMFEKRHSDVIRAIENLIEGITKNASVNERKNGAVDSPENSGQLFHKSRYKDEKGEYRKKYLMNRDGFSLLVMGFTGKKALEWKMKYLKAFNKMEAIIREKATQTWVETRQYGKLTRKAETDTIQRLVEYAKEQGSEHSDKLYMVYTRLANRMAGVENRDESTVRQLNNLVMMEDIILHVIDLGILAQKHYKEIYKDCKRRLETVKELAFLETA